MATEKEYGHPYDATNSWNGYNHQGKIALWYAIQTVIELWDNSMRVDQNREALEKYFLELEYEEDFSIGKHLPGGKIYLSIHQVKARANASIDSYRDAILALLAKVMNRNTIEKAYLHVSQDMHISRDEFLQKVNEFAQAPKGFEAAITANRNDPAFRETFYASKRGRPASIKAAVWSALKEKSSSETSLNEKNLDQAFDEYLKTAGNLSKASKAQQEKLYIFEYPDLPKACDKQGYCELNQVQTLLENVIVAYYKKTDPNGWRSLNPEYIHKVYLYLLDRLDNHVMTRQLNRSAYLSEALDRTIPLSEIANWLETDAGNLGEHYYLYHLKEELFKAMNEYCCECRQKPAQCTKCHIDDAREKIGAMPYDKIKEFIYIVNPHKCGKINIDSYASFADISGLQNPFSKGLRDISVPFSSKADMVPIAYYNAERKQYVLTTIQPPGTDGGKSSVCRKIVENANVYSLLMDCDALISKDICSDSVWTDAEMITDTGLDPKQTEHIIHCKNVKIVPLDSCQRSFIDEEEQL